MAVTVAVPLFNWPRYLECALLHHTPWVRHDTLCYVTLRCVTVLYGIGPRDRSHEIAFIVA